MEELGSNADLIVVIGIIVLMLAIGTGAFSYLEGWTLVDSLYFSVSTITTIGYGDLVPTSDGSKLVMIGYALVGISLLLFLLSKMTAREERFVEKMASHLVRRRERSIEELEEQVKSEVKSEVQEHVEKEVKRHVEKEVQKQIDRK